MDLDKYTHAGKCGLANVLYGDDDILWVRYTMGRTWKESPVISCDVSGNRFAARIGLWHARVYLALSLKFMTPGLGEGVLWPRSSYTPKYFLASFGGKFVKADTLPVQRTREDCIHAVAPP